MSKGSSPDKYGKVVKLLQILSFILMLGMVVLCISFLSKNNISVSNVGALTQYLTGGTITIALIIIGFSIVKSFALIFPPAVLFVLSGIVFDSMWVAVLVNAIATACSIILPYFLGKFMGMELVNSLKGRFKAIKKLDDFAGENSFALVFVFKAGGLMPSDLSSLIFGAMNIPFGKYFVASNLGLLILNVLWTLLGAKGDLSNPLSYLYALPALVFAILASVIMSKRQKKKALSQTTETEVINK
ncbi:MAG: VTT domain-containing protein [Clostridia bacterium]|nr:VTT domain-containing protein [Clostridia bacterium]